MRVELGPSDFTRLSLVAFAVSAGTAAWRFRQAAVLGEVTAMALREVTRHQAAQIEALQAAVGELAEQLGDASEADVHAAVANLLADVTFGEGSNALVVRPSNPGTLNVGGGPGADGEWLWYAAVRCECGCLFVRQMTGWAEDRDLAVAAAEAAVDTALGINHTDLLEDQQTGDPGTT